ncbi:MAG: PrpF protein [Acidaminococcus sp.]|jgi:2-methylaconitate cis-trans-isomerase PrpF|nr:PrpF protein [Acidaminococcus sp.]MCI2115120.1 PrpF protein [Acidaminococcus sp.]MCI2117196.1 PrpF protein [Acidaminococcus sp.]
MRKFRTVYMRGGTSKGCLFHREDLPTDPKEWDSIFLQVMGNPDPKQMDGMGGTVSSNNKIVVIWKSQEPDVDIEYLVGQVIVGKSQVDYKSNCGNMTAAVPAYAVEEGMVPIVEPVTMVRMLNKNTDKKINVTVPIDPETHTFAQNGDCHIAGIDGNAAELRVNFLDPAGSKTGKLLPTGRVLEGLDIDGKRIEATLVDVSNPLILVRAEDVGLMGTELPAEVDANKRAATLLEKIRGTAAVMMGFARNLEDAKANSPAVPKVGVFTGPKTYKGIGGDTIEAASMDVCVRVISVFKCHKACPLTAANSVAVMSKLKESIIDKTLHTADALAEGVRIGHPSGVMTQYVDMEESNGTVKVNGVAGQRTARRIMDGFVYVRN